MRHRFDIDGAGHELWLAQGGTAGTYRMVRDADTRTVKLSAADGHTARLTVDGSTRPVLLAREGDVIHVVLDGVAFAVRYHPPLQLEGGAEVDGHAVVRAPMPGTVLEVAVTLGQTVAAGDRLVVIESMKLETTLRATAGGVVESIGVRPGDSFDRDAVLVTLTMTDEEA